MGTDLVRARAFSAACPQAFLTGWAATVMCRLPTIGSPPLLPVALRPRDGPGGSKETSYGRIVVAHLPAHHRWRIGSAKVVSRAWAALEVARTSPLPDALVVADAAVRNGADLLEVVPFMRRWESVSQAEWVATHASSNAESALETLGRFTCLEFALPMPVCNAWVGDGQPRYRVDGLWPFHWSAFEGDGAIKYDNRPDASQVIAAQNEREWYLRRLGLDFARFRWELARWASLRASGPVSSAAPGQSATAFADQVVEGRARRWPGGAGARRLALAVPGGNCAADQVPAVIGMQLTTSRPRVPQ
jgi:hypothetical protein